MGQWVLHVDLDQFIAAVEVLRHPELRGRPVVVGGDGDPTKRGVVSTASYEAREHGVHSGLPLRTAARRLSSSSADAVFLPVDREAYDEVSASVMDVLRTSGRWSRCWAGTRRSWVSTRPIRRRSRGLWRLECVLRPSWIARWGSGRTSCRPRSPPGSASRPGFRLTSANWFEVLGARPTDALWGIGAKTAKKLAGLGINTVSDLAAADPDALAAAFGPMTGPWLVLLGRGRATPTWTIRRTWPAGTARRRRSSRTSRDWSRVQAEVARLAGLLAVDLVGEGPPAVRVVVRCGTRCSSPRRTG